MVMTRTSHPAGRCPSWCAVRHGEHTGEEDLLHVSRAVVVGRTTVHLCASVSPGELDGPYVLVGDEEYTLAEASTLARVVADMLGQALTHHAAP
jgi:hypothetical protein